MTRDPIVRVVFRDYPVGIWFTGLIALAVAAVFFITDVPKTQALLVTLIGSVFIALASVLTVTVDQSRGILRLNYRSLLRASTKAYPLSDIAIVNVAQDREGERMYRLELIRYSGEIVPLRSGYLVGRKHHERKAQRLRSVLGGRGELP
jgi:hypothetical protein